MGQGLRTLLITGSGDGTADLLLPFFHSKVVRIDLDTLHEKGFALHGQSFEFAGERHDIAGFSAVYWRKPSEPILKVQQVDQLAEFELRQRLYALRAVSLIARRQGIWHLIDPLQESHFPKPLQLAFANRYFSIPEWSVRVGSKMTGDKKNIVSKALAPEPVQNGRFLVTTRVEDPSRLHPDHTWFLQQEIDAAFDATVVCCADRMWGFALRRSYDQTWVDWRIVMDNHRSEKWSPVDIPEGIRRAILEYLAFFGTHFARVDFLIDRFSRWWFLEANMNGQFGWLDHRNARGMLEHVAGAAESPQLCRFSA